MTVHESCCGASIFDRRQYPTRTELATAVASFAIWLILITESCCATSTLNDSKRCPVGREHLLTERLCRLVAIFLLLQGSRGRLPSYLFTVKKWEK